MNAVSNDWPGEIYALVLKWHKSYGSNQPLSDCIQSLLQKIELTPGTVKRAKKKPGLSRPLTIEEDYILQGNMITNFP